MAQMPVGFVPDGFVPDPAPAPVQRDARGMPAVSSNVQEGEPSPLLEMLGPFAHPQTLVDFGRLLNLPVDMVRGAATRAVAMAAARAPAGAALSATGRGLEATGTAAAEASPTIGAVDLLTSHKPVRAIAIAAAPKVMQMAGRGLQRAGAAVSGAAPIAAEVAPGASVAGYPRGGVTPASAVAPAAAEVAPGASMPGYPRGGTIPAPAAAPVATATPAGAPIVDEFTAARTARQASSGLPDQKALNEAALAVRRAAYQATQQGTAPAAVEKIVAASGKMKLTADEFKEFTRLLKQPGMTLPKAEQAVKAARELATQLGGASSAEVTKAVKHMQATGKW